MHEVDFLPVGAGEKSGDAIALRFTAPNPANNNQVVVIIDGGFSEVGSNLANHVEKYYGTSRADLVISTHPDADHINGLCNVLEEMEVGELLLHLPSNHGYPQNVWGDAVAELNALARRRGVPVTEPFTGLQRFEGALTIIGPTQDYYRELLARHVEEARAGKSLATTLGEALQQLAKRTVSALPFVETLGEDGATTPCNNSSVITYWQIDGQRLLLTGDAGIPALRQATDLLMNWWHGASTPLNFVQVPHHGSRQNLAPSLLDDLLGPRHAPFSSTTTAFISASREAPKHPSPKVTNAVQRRGCSVYTNEDGSLLHGYKAASRPGWGSAIPVRPMDEGEDD
jgi:beta-lactamase superfamily II metal-dependent hydrolase